MEKEKNALEGEKNKAVDFLTLENDIFKHKSQLCQYYVWAPAPFLCSLQDQWNNNITSLNFSVDPTVKGEKKICSMNANIY